MISVYAIGYRRLEYIKATIESLRKTASEPFRLVCIDALSSRSQEIREYLKDVADVVIGSSGNCRGYGLTWAFENILPESSEGFSVITDLDVIPDFDWLKALRASYNTEHILTGFGLKTENYVSPNSGFDLNGFGSWLMGVDSNIYKEYCKKYKFHLDSQVIQFFQSKGRILKYDNPKLYHLGWDLWKDDPEYWQEKLKGIDWTKNEGYEYTIF